MMNSPYDNINRVPMSTSVAMQLQFEKINRHSVGMNDDGHHRHHPAVDSMMTMMKEKKNRPEDAWYHKLFDSSYRSGLDSSSRDGATAESSPEFVWVSKTNDDEENISTTTIDGSDVDAWVLKDKTLVRDDDVILDELEMYALLEKQAFAVAAGGGTKKKNKKDDDDDKNEEDKKVIKHYYDGRTLYEV